MSKSDTQQFLSQLGYAKHRGVTHGAVAKAIKTGRLSRCLHTDAAGKVTIDPVVADQEWDANTNAMKRTNGSPEVAAGRAKPTPGGKKDAKFDADGIMLTKHELAEAAEGASLADSRALKELYLAKLAQLDYETKSGKLIDADEARSTAFNAARAARNMLLTIADRLAPVVAGLTDQFECHQAISAEIRLVCEALAGNPLEPKQ